MNNNTLKKECNAFEKNIYDKLSKMSIQGVEYHRICVFDLISEYLTDYKIKLN